MNIFVVCPHCKRPVSKNDLDEHFIGRYGNIESRDFLPMPCLHCSKSAYEMEWKPMTEEPKKLNLTEDMFTL